MLALTAASGHRHAMSRTRRLRHPRSATSQSERTIRPSLGQKSTRLSRQLNLASVVLPVERNLALATRAASQVTGRESVPRTSRATTHVSNVKAIVSKDPVRPTTIAVLANLDGVPRHLLQALQRPRRPTTTLSTGAQHANVGRPLIRLKRTLVALHAVQKLRQLP